MYASFWWWLLTVLYDSRNITTYLCEIATSPHPVTTHLYLTPPKRGSTKYVGFMFGEQESLCHSALPCRHSTPVRDARTDTAPLRLSRCMYASRGKSWRCFLSQPRISYPCLSAVVLVCAANFSCWLAVFRKPGNACWLLIEFQPVRRRYACLVHTQRCSTQR